MGDKLFLTYNQQMRRLRDNKKIICQGSPHKKILIRVGYFNLINGYKTPFVSYENSNGEHSYITGTSISQIYAVKLFDDDVRSLLLKYITQIEEEVRTLTAYKFDEHNSNGFIPWYDPSAYSPNATLQNKMRTISNAYDELSKSRQEYVNFYMSKHTHIPTWIMMKAINFSTFIDVLNYSKMDVTHDICNLYSIFDSNGLPDVKLLVGSMHWLRKTRNSCAHNERIYCIKGSGRIKDPYLLHLGAGYLREKNQNLFDLLVYMKYYLPHVEYKCLITRIKNLLTDLYNQIHPHAFDYVRGQMGIKNMKDLDLLLALPKSEIEYNKFG